MAATPSLKVVKTLTYRGVVRTFSNRYHFAGGTPADSAHWTTFSDAVVTAEKAIYGSNVAIVQTYGYAAGSEVPVFAKTYTPVVGTGAWTNQTPGDVAFLVRYATAARSSKNHPVYLFNYYHGARMDALSTPDLILAAQKTAADGFAGQWVSAGFSDGTTSYHRAGPNGATATGYLTEQYLTHRDFPR